jgi:hypothetical protein
MADVGQIAAIAAPYLTKCADALATSLGTTIEKETVKFFVNLKKMINDKSAKSTTCSNKEDLKSQIDSIKKDLITEMKDDPSLVENLKHCLNEIEKKIIIDDFDSGIWGFNKLGGLALVYHENGDPLTLKHDFVSRGNGRALNLSFDFGEHTGYVPPLFVGYATRLQFHNWTNFIEDNGYISFDLKGSGAKDIYLEIKRLPVLYDENIREEIAKYLIYVENNWKTIVLDFSAIKMPNKKWDNLWELCFVVRQENRLGDKGNILIDNIYVARDNAV